MQKDASFLDGDEQPLHLKALDVDDLQVISTLLQDAVLPITEIAYQARNSRLALLVNRFRWEDKDNAALQGRGFERVQAMLVLDNVLKVASTGINLADTDQVISLLSADFEPGRDGGGRIILTLAGDGAVAADVECIDVTLKDVTRPYLAPSQKAPSHKLS